MKLSRPLAIGAIACTALVFAITNSSGESRSWTQAASGRKIDAEYVDMKDDATVRLKMRNGQTAEVPVASLSAEDQEYIKTQNAPKDEAKPGTVPKGETTIVVSNVHLCCGGCEKGVQTAMLDDEGEPRSDMEGVVYDVDRKEKTVTITAKTGAQAKKAAAALNAVGYWGTSDNSAIPVPYKKGGDDLVTNTMQVRDLHLCCGACVKAVSKALKGVDGVKDNNAKEKSDRFTITGKDFNPAAVMAALREAGFGGTWQ